MTEGAAVERKMEHMMLHICKDNTDLMSYQCVLL